MMDKILHIIKRFIPKKLFKALQPPYHFLMNLAAAVFYGFPSEEMVIIGVTGTTGKTTTVYILAKTLEKLGFKVGYTSTAMFNDGEREWSNDKKMTMIGRLFTQKMLKKMLKNGCRFAIIETTSEGIVQYRHRFINYDFLVFTGLYPEHIESHGSFENYKRAKGRLFEHLKNCRHKYADSNYAIKKNVSGLKKTELKRIAKTIIVNADDPNAPFFLSFPSDEKWEFSAGKAARSAEKNFTGAYDIKADPHGTGFRVGGFDFRLNLLGEFNVINALPAVAIGGFLGRRLGEIARVMKTIGGAPGRLEKIDQGQDFVLIVDYAFEPNALKKLYETIRKIEHKRVIHVLGAAGGGRDKAKRPVLGEIAGRNSDITVITNEDPYDEDPEIIMDQVSLGAERAGKKKGINLFLIPDRREAIRKALQTAKDSDLVLVTGKGNEQAICISKGEKIPWDDREVCRNILKSYHR